MLPRPALAVLAALLALLAVPLLPTSAQDRPPGVPAGAERATVTGHVDGDKFKVSLNREGQTILLAGLDAPEPGECFAQESADRIEALLPRRTSVWLERSGEDRDGQDRLLRYVWLSGEGGEDAYLLNTKLVREGFAGFDDRHDNPAYYDNLHAWQIRAQDRNAGVWGACGQLHAPAPEVLAGLPAGLEEATVERVTDGDTIRVRHPDGRVEPIRLGARAGSAAGSIAASIADRARSAPGRRGRRWRRRRQAASPPGR